MASRARPLPSREDISDDMPLRLDLAARLAFADGTIGASALRAEAAKGRLQVWRIAGKDMTTLAAIRGMIDLCRANDCPPASGFAQPVTTEKPSGSSSTVASSAALAALKLRARRLKES
jgi:hypothetical protein